METTALAVEERRERTARSTADARARCSPAVRYRQLNGRRARKRTTRTTPERSEDTVSAAWPLSRRPAPMLSDSSGDGAAALPLRHLSGLSRLRGGRRGRGGTGERVGHTWRRNDVGVASGLNYFCRRCDLCTPVRYTLGGHEKGVGGAWRNGGGCAGRQVGDAE